MARIPSEKLTALMYWLLAFWPQLAKRVRREGELNFLARLRRRPRRVLVQKKSEIGEIDVRDLKPGDIAILQQGDTVPGDIGDCEKERDLADQADVAITVANSHSTLTEEFPVTFLDPDIEKLALFQSFCQTHKNARKSSFTVATLPNLLAVAAAVYFNTPALVSVVITTLGASACYRQASRLLRQASGAGAGR